MNRTDNDDEVKMLPPRSMGSGVYTALMTESEAQAALGIVQRAHLLRLIVAHARKHVKLERGAAWSFLGFKEAVFPGAFIKDLAGCDECLPALMLARGAGVRVTDEVHLSEAAAEALHFDEWLDHFRAERIGG